MPRRNYFHVCLNAVSGNISEANEPTLINLERIAIDQLGSIGSFYNAYEDNINGRLNTTIKPQICKSSQQIVCKLTKGRAAECQNLLRFADIDHQLRLSIYLELTRATGIASLMNNSQLIDDHTRLFYIYQESSIEFYEKDLHELKKSIQSSTCETFATHIITEIVFGIHLLLILKLPPGYEDPIDIFLQNLKENLINSKPLVKIDSQLKTLLDKVPSTTVYSNIDTLAKMKNLPDIYEKLIKLQTNDKEHKKLKYVLCPIHWFCGRHHVKLPEEVENLEHYLIQQKSELKLLNFRINHDLSELLQGSCQSAFETITEELSKLQALHMNNIERLKNLVLEIRKGTIPLSSLDKQVSLDPPKDIQQLIKNITTRANELEFRIKRVKQMKKDGFEYCDVETLGITDQLKENRIQDMLLGNDSHKVILCSNDELMKSDELAFTKVYSEMIEKRKKNPEICLVYADFTYSTYELRNTSIVLSEDLKEKQNQSKSPSTVNNLKEKSSPPPQPSLQQTSSQSLDQTLPISSSSNEFINILLLGESGVGKSTFINAFANYLHFESLNDAEKGKPIVIIPVSFVMAVNDNFDEKTIKFGEFDSNENHNNAGQSVTQQCKSYAFSISNERKLRIIDTPGFGDTRGNDQDNLNMEEIFSFLHNINYLNGICLLFKPEVVELNPYLQSCCSQLFQYFGGNILGHFIFCFTNARSTFFAPGNTRPLLEEFFTSFHMKKIPLKKTNTFCFDSESFRYLVAIQDSFEFDSTEREEIEQSWLRSVTESERFSNFLCKQSSYRKNIEWQSMKDVQFQINFMIRPIVETMRNVLRNIILFDLHASIKLSAKPAIPSSKICYKCSRQPDKYDRFWILPDQLHNPPKMCPSNDQKSTEYRLEYEAVGHQVEESIDELNEYLALLCKTSAKLAQFLMKISQMQHDDPFVSEIDRMIDEENVISQGETTRDLNKKLMDKLKQLKTYYQKQKNQTERNQSTSNLAEIYNLLNVLNGIPMVSIQLEAIKNYQQTLLESNQRDISTTKTK
ncbi:unnamed protein product [Rotaria magnacalcarata]|uniref:AIG1-type G domain-containing protein n=3 Tax=Rotaria magnacalcarata TaxID=392030 RepID=A0A815AE50_9BILA|nr:unnamed protein product [Rotaria magnacalcarata]